MYLMGRGVSIPYRLYVIQPYLLYLMYLEDSAILMGAHVPYGNVAFWRIVPSLL